LFTVGPTTQATIVPIKRELFMCEGGPILMGSLEVREHPQAHTLVLTPSFGPPSGEPTYIGTSPTTSKPATRACIDWEHPLRIMIKHFPTISSIKSNVKSRPPTNSIP
jgi:hypothetical protein